MGLRTPKNYDGTKCTNHSLAGLLPSVLSQVKKLVEVDTQSIFSLWPQIVGEKLAPMTEVVSFVEGNLTVKVKNSTLLSLLMTHDKSRILKRLKEIYPKNTLKNVFFKMG